MLLRVPGGLYATGESVLSTMTTEPTPALPVLLTTKQVAKALCVSEWTVWRMKAAGEIPSVVLHNGCLRYHPADVQAIQRGAIP